MPFQSEQQRKYLWANEPEIAKRWEKYPKGYGTGGVSHLFRSKSAQGGYIRPEDSGVLGLADGGNIRLQPHTASDLLVQKTSSGERPKYQPPGGGATSLGSGRDYSGNEGSSSGPSGQDYGMSPGEAQARGIGAQHHGSTTSQDTTQQTEREGGETSGYVPGIGEVNPQASPEMKALIERQVEEKKDPVAHTKKRGFWGTMALLLGAYTGLAPLFGVKIGSGVKTASFILNKRNQINTALKYGKKLGLIDKNVSFDNFVKDQVDKAKINYQDRKTKIDLYNSLPDGHPEKIQLQIDLQIGKKPEHLGDSGGNIDITYKNIEETNTLKKDIADSEASYDMRYAPIFEEEEEDRSKQMAYWQALMAPYMSAQGGRVPQGYNTGGLSNLFRLKNK